MKKIEGWNPTYLVGLGVPIRQLGPAFWPGLTVESPRHYGTSTWKSDGVLGSRPEPGASRVVLRGRVDVGCWHRQVTRTGCRGEG